MAGLKIKKGDHVVVLTGKDKGKKGEVLKVLPSENRAVVQGVAQMRKHQRQTASQEGASSPRKPRSIFRISRLRIPRMGNPRASATNS